MVGWIAISSEREKNFIVIPSLTVNPIIHLLGLLGLHHWKFKTVSALNNWNHNEEKDLEHHF